MPTELAHSRLLSLLDFDPSTGVFRWIGSPQRGAVPSAIAGIVVRGRQRIRVLGRYYLAHRLAWFYVHAAWPRLIDHIDGDPLNNRLSNLRDATRAVNGQNQRRAHRDNAAGLLGVTRNVNTGGRFRAKLKAADGRYVHVGLFDTAEEAHEAYVLKKRELQPGCSI